MCGINAIINFDKRLSRNELINKIIIMNSSLSHRGPDSNNYYLADQDKIIMGSTRLSITGDLEKGEQPLRKKNNIIIFNGEIYNFKELEEELFYQDKTYNNASKSDTEFLINLYNQYEDKYFYKLEGMFSFIILDNFRKKAILSKDFFGKKPLYFTYFENNIYFSSEIAALKKVIPISHFRLNEDSVLEFISFGYGISEKTIFKNVFIVKKKYYFCN